MITSRKSGKSLFFFVISILQLSFFAGDVPFVLWSVVVTLLSDDEPLVREQMALSFSMLLKRVQTSETGLYMQM